MLTYSVAFISGLLSFFSPCVLPVMPGYLCFMVSCSPQGERATALGRKERYDWLQGVLLASAFVLGFALVFVTLGLLVSRLHGFLAAYRLPFVRLSAALVIIFGLSTLGWFRLRFLEGDLRWHPRQRPLASSHPAALVLSACLLGAAFGFGWTPCIGPVLGSILVLAAHGDSPQQGACLLVLYSVGLGLPLVFMAAFFHFFMRLIPGLSGVMPIVRRLSGGMLVVIGLLMWMDKLHIFAGV